MRKIIFYVTQSVDKEEYIANHSSSLIFYDSRNKKYYLNSKFESEPKEILVNMILLKFNELNQELSKTLLNELEKMYFRAMEDAAKITSEPIGKLENCSHPGGAIFSVLFKYITKYKDEERSIFEFIGDLFIQILQQHILKNGNKRTAICFIKLVSNYFGYYFKWTGGFYEDYSMHEKKLENLSKD